MARARSGGGGNGAMIGLVVFGACFFVCLILAILFYTKVSTAEQAAAEAQADLAEVISSGEQSRIEEFTDGVEGRTAVAKLINRIEADRGEINGLQGQVVDMTSSRDLAQTEAQSQKEAADQARADLARVNENRSAMEAELTQRVAEMTSTIATISAENDNLRSRVDSSIQDVEASYRQQIDQQNVRIAELNAEISGLQRTIADQQVTIVTLRGERPPDIPLTDADATVVAQIPDQNKVYLDIGSDSGLRKGMSFTVFDPDVLVKLEGADLEKGKAVVDIINVDATTAVGLVVARKPRAVIRDGDALVNIVYDPRRIYSFHVFGQFDLDYDGDIDDFGLDRVKSRVVGSNGRLVDEIGFTTDFVVLGVEPELPARPEDELDLLKMREYSVGLENYQAYQDRIAMARDLGVPVLNQNRFLDLVGYSRR